MHLSIFTRSKATTETYQPGQRLRRLRRIRIKRHCTGTCLPGACTGTAGFPKQEQIPSKHQGISEMMESCHTTRDLLPRDSPALFPWMQTLVTFVRASFFPTLQGEVVCRLKFYKYIQLFDLLMRLQLNILQQSREWINSWIRNVFPRALSNQRCTNITYEQL